MPLAIASPSDHAYSETFIRMQMERLPCALRIHGRPVASETVPGGPIAPLKSVRGLFDLGIECGLRGKRWEGPQARELARRLKRAGSTVLLANYGPTGVAMAPICAKLGIRLVVHFHGYDAHMESVLEEYGDAYRAMGETADALVAVSGRMEESLVRAGLPPSKIVRACYGVDSDRFQARSDIPSTPNFFAVGRFTDKKAPYLTVLAFARLRERFPEARLVMAGTGELWEATRNLANALGLGDSVAFPGVLSPDEVAHGMRNATAFVQHSLTPEVGPMTGDSEGTPVAVLEAMMSGVPVISTRHAGIGEVVEDGKTGFLVDERDVEGMADAMVELAENPGRTREMGENARREAERRYTAKHYIDSLGRVLGIGGGADPVE